MDRYLGMFTLLVAVLAGLNFIFMVEGAWQVMHWLMAVALLVALYVTARSAKAAKGGEGDMCCRYGCTMFSATIVVALLFFSMWISGGMYIDMSDMDMMDMSVTNACTLMHLAYPIVVGCTGWERWKK